MNKWMLDTNAVRALVDGYSPRLDGLFGEQRCCWRFCLGLMPAPLFMAAFGHCRPGRAGRLG